MAAAEEWTAIAEACEAATESDRELDIRIALAAGVFSLAIYPTNTWAMFKRDQNPPHWRYCFTCRMDEGCASEADARADAVSTASGLLARIPYTSSIDAITGAIALVFPGHPIRADLSSFMDDGNCCTHICKRRMGCSSVHIARAEASTPALALCAAFARAMAEREGMKEAANG